MFTYVTLGSNDIERSIRFYDPVMASLGHRRCHEGGVTDLFEWAGWGTFEDGQVIELALWLVKPFDGGAATAGNGAMIAFDARTRADVDAFHRAALESGGVSEGEPGVRPHYGPTFYAAYVRDPDGNKLAAVCRTAV
ncbi:VOC family protein [Pararobbsia silviterrae]|uniref:VOC family protein n=1 Tax=Pararobbsia silviterrae TaxID=1792498 RepID=A0A494XZ40_9BURK|nr:VOC family protein [Pararobbsia silviterrae]RKP53349.1 VOC family protein [Pararobbsia silviterrae]